MTEIFNILKWFIDMLWGIIETIIDIFELIFIVLPQSLISVAETAIYFGHLGSYMLAIVSVLLTMGILRILLALK